MISLFNSFTCASNFLIYLQIYGSSIIRFLDDPTDSIELVRDVDTLVAYRLPKDDDGSRLVVFQHQCKEK